MCHFPLAPTCSSSSSSILQAQATAPMESSNLIIDRPWCTAARSVTLVHTLPHNLLLQH
jgi:hypothetical protein